MRASLLAALLLVLVLTPGSGRAQAHEGAAREDAWNAYPEPAPAPAPSPEDGDALFVPNSFPGASSASALPEVHTGDTAAPESPAPRYVPPPPVIDAAPAGDTESPIETGGVAVEAPPGASLEPSSGSMPLDNSGPATVSTPRQQEGTAASSAPIAHSETSEPLSPETPASRFGATANDGASRPSLFPSPGPRLSPYRAPEPLAVPLLRSLLDMAGASVVTLVGAVGVEALVGTRCLRETERMCILTSFLVTFLSVSGTAPVGAWAVGSLLGGEGKLWAAYIGSAMGMGLGVVGTMPTMAFGSGVILAVAGPIGAVLGAAIGYEVSHRMSLRPSRPSSARASAPRMTPMLSATPRGSLVGGMMGRF